MGGGNDHAAITTSFEMIWGLGGFIDKQTGAWGAQILDKRHFKTLQKTKTS
jgi:hypothetical protein